jgi:uncharacterized repeat protein (TIGR02543 family)
LGQKPSFINLLLVGEAGCGKTERVEAWAKKNNINLVKMLTSTMDQGDWSVMAPNADHSKAVKLTTDNFDVLNEPNTVLFLDEYNRADFTIRGALLTLINNHEVPTNDVDKNGKKLFNKVYDNFLFTVVAINPSDSGYNVQQLDPAELSRLGRVDVKMDPKATKYFLINHFKKLLSLAEDKEEENLYKWILTLVNVLLDEDNKFQFDNKQEIQAAARKGVAALNPRSLTFALDALNYPTFKDLEEKFKRHSNPTKWEYVRDILLKNKFNDLTKINLDDYEEIYDIATNVLRTPSSSETLNKILNKQPSKQTELDDIDTDDEDFAELEEVTTYNMYLNNEFEAQPQIISEVTNIPEVLPTPTKNGYTFAGWFYDRQFTRPVEFKQELKADIQLYAKWVQNQPERPVRAQGLRAKINNAMNVN